MNINNTAKACLMALLVVFGMFASVAGAAVLCCHSEGSVHLAWGGHDADAAHCHAQAEAPPAHHAHCFETCFDIEFDAANLDIALSSTSVQTPELQERVMANLAKMYLSAAKQHSNMCTPVRAPPEIPLVASATHTCIAKTVFLV